MARSIRDLLGQAAQRLQQASDSPRLDAELLLAHCLGRDRIWLMAWPEHEPEAGPLRCFEALIERRAGGEPMAYLLGEREFWSLPLTVTPDTLVPRPETELLVETALELIADRTNPSVLELGTGSGAIALALKKERPDARITASDVSEAALAVAARNGQKLGLDIHWLCSDWYQGLPAGRRYDLIVSNPPYIAADDPWLGRGDLPAEPQTALCSGPSGLEAVETIIAAAPRHLLPGAALALEHGHEQQAALRSLLEAAGFESVACRRDLAGLPRVSLGHLPGS